MTARFPTLTVALAMAVTLVGGATAADAKSCKKRYSDRCGYATEQQRQSASEKEWEHTRAKAYDPGGSYSGYPDWARYALSPKGSR